MWLLQMQVCREGLCEVKGCPSDSECGASGLLKELAVRNMRSDGSAKASRKYFSGEGGHFGMKELR